MPSSRASPPTCPLPPERRRGTDMTDSCTATDFPYLHGFSPTEQARLMKQARLAESTIFRNIDYAGATRLLEVGSGVGAQTEIGRASCRERGWTGRGAAAGGRR